MVLDFFRRGRGLTLLAGCAVVLLLFAFVVDDRRAVNIFAIGAGVIGFLFVSMSISARKHSEGLIKEALLRTARLETQVAEASTAIQNQNRLVERQSLSLLTSGTHDEIDNPRRQHQSIFAPTTIPASEIIGRPSAHTAGRIAADQVMNEDSEDVLYALMRAPREAWKRKIELIGSTCLEDSLSAIAQVRRIVAPHLLGSPDPDASYLIVDENQLQKGLWDGILTTQKTAKFFRLIKHISRAKEYGMVVIVQASEFSAHFTDELRGEATVIFNEGSANWDWEDDLYLPVLRAMYSNEVRVDKEIQPSTHSKDCLK